MSEENKPVEEQEPKLPRSEPRPVEDPDPDPEPDPDPDPRASDAAVTKKDFDALREDVRKATRRLNRALKAAPNQPAIPAPSAPEPEPERKHRGLGYILTQMERRKPKK